MTDYDLPEEIPGADKALDLVKMGTDKLFNLAWRYMAYKHRRDEVTFIFLEHARAFTEETIMLLHSGADVPTVGERSVIVGPGVVSGEDALLGQRQSFDEVASRRVAR